MDHGANATGPTLPPTPPPRLDRDDRLRPAVDAFDHAGYSVDIIDGPGILAAAVGRRVDLLPDSALGPPVALARLSVTRDPRVDRQQFLLEATVRTSDEPDPLVTATALGSDPLSLLLTRRAMAGDRWAARVVDGMGVVADRVSQRVRPRRGPAPEPVVGRETQLRDPATGLVATIRYATPVSDDTDRPADAATLRAAVPEPDMSLDHLRAMCRMFLDVVVELSHGGTADRTLTLSATADATQQVTLDQVGGLDDIVSGLRQIAVSFRHPDAMARWGARRPQGLLLYGPPGTGKTMLARSLSHEIGARFQEIHTPDILEKWLGASERNIKRIFRDARRYREPTVMLFDEFDSIISYAGEGGDSASQAINAVAGIFKQEMNDLIEANPRVIVVATTNFPDRVDASLIRSGRFDVKLLVPAPNRTGRAQILVKMIRQLIAAYEVGGFRMFADDIDVDALAAETPDMTGADLAEVLRRAQLAKAMQEARTSADASAIGQHDLLRHIVEMRAEGVRVPRHT
jgi:transitional endoplasmic reticulum ATPase